MTPEIKIEMSKKDVQEALADYVNRQSHWINGQYVTAKDVVIEVGKEYYDRQPGGSGTVVFKRAIITVKTEEEFMSDGIKASLEA